MWRALKTILKTAVYLIVIFCGLFLFSAALHQRSIPGMGVGAGLCLLGFLGFVALFWGHHRFGTVTFVISLLVVLFGGGVFFLVPRPMAHLPTESVPPAEQPRLLRKIETTATGAANDAVGETRKSGRVEYKTRAVHSLSSVSSQLRTLQATARAADASAIRETVRGASVSDSVTEKVAPAVAEAVKDAVSKGVPADKANEAAAAGLDKAATAPSEIDRLLEGLQSANIAYNAPETLGYGRTFVIKLELSANKTPEELAGTIHEPGPTETATVKISNEMDARLTGEQFEIKAVRPERQAVSATGTEWTWNIKPRELGPQKLHLTLDAVLKIDNHESTYTLKTFDRTIGVNVVWPETWFVFFGKYWQWIVTTIVIPFVVWIGKKIFKG
jgi:hypothetical protein